MAKPKLLIQFEGVLEEVGTGKRGVRVRPDDPEAHDRGDVSARLPATLEEIQACGAAIDGRVRVTVELEREGDDDEAGALNRRQKAVLQAADAWAAGVDNSMAITQGKAAQALLAHVRALRSEDLV